MKKVLSSVLIAGVAIVPTVANTCNASFSVNGRPAAHYEVCYDKDARTCCEKNGNMYIVCNEKDNEKSESFIWKSIKVVVKLALALGIPLATAAVLMSKYSPNGEWGKWLGEKAKSVKNSEFVQDKIVKNYNDMKNSDFVKKTAKTWSDIKMSDYVQKPYNFMAETYKNMSNAVSTNYNSFKDTLK